MGDPEHRVVRANPATDLAFVALIGRLLPQARDTGHLQDSLRATHPRAVIRARGLEGERAEIWYAYRDGSWSDPHREP